MMLLPIFLFQSNLKSIVVPVFELKTFSCLLYLIEEDFNDINLDLIIC
jgi:hypothetical protein